ncbi:MAG: phosphoserine phosphatase [Thermoplasmata archaeon]
MKTITVELEQKIEHLDIKAGDYKKKRDLLNNDIKKWIDIRDNLNIKVRDIIKEANEHKEKRDTINNDVKTIKDQRRELNHKVSLSSKNVSAIKQVQLPKDNPRKLEQLKKEMQRLEFKQMTTVLTPGKEKEIIDQLAKLQHELKEQEKLIEQNEHIQSAIREFKTARDEAEGVHKKLKNLADQAQIEHEKMLALYESADAARKEADSAQEKFLDAKTAADDVHKRYIAIFKQIRTLIRIATSLKMSQKRIKKSQMGSIAKKEADDIYTRFKNGEMLSTEDLMSLQRAGLL